MRLIDSEVQYWRIIFNERAGVIPEGDAPARFPCFQYFDEFGSVKYLYANDVVDMCAGMGIEVYGRS